MSAWLDIDPADFGVKPTPPTPLFDLQAATGADEGLFDLHNV